MNQAEALEDLQSAYAEWRAGTISRDDFREIVNAHGKMIGYFKCDLVDRQLQLCESKQKPMPMLGGGVEDETAKS